MKTRFAVLLSLSLLSAALIAGCGGSGNESAGGSSGTAGAGSTASTTAASTAGTAGTSSTSAMSSSTSSTSGAGASAGGVSGKLQLAFVTNNSADFWTIARKGTEAASQKLGDVDVQFVIPADGTAATQTSQVDDLIAKGIQGFAISPVDPANQTQMINNAASKALVITQDSDAPNSNRAFYLGTDNVAAGKQAGEMIKQAIPNGGDIMLFVGKKDAQNAKDRLDGIESVLNGSNIHILDVRTDDTDRTRAVSNVSDTLVKYPNIAGLVGLWSYNGPAILNAVKQANMVGKVKIIAFDEEPDTLAGVKSGAIVGTVVQKPYEFGYQAIEMMDKILRGDKSLIPTSKHKYIPTQVLRQADIAQYQAYMQKIRGS